MKTKRRWPWRCLAGLSLSLALGSLSGCQTWVPAAGLTLPSGHYLKHPPQYFAESPPYPLSRELASMQAAENLGAAGSAPIVPVPAAPPPPALPAPSAPPALAPVPGVAVPPAPR